MNCRESKDLYEGLKRGHDFLHENSNRECSEASPVSERCPEGVQRADILLHTLGTPPPSVFPDEPDPSV